MGIAAMLETGGVGRAHVTAVRLASCVLPQPRSSAQIEQKALVDPAVGFAEDL
jgi:hypothetical protein